MADPKALYQEVILDHSRKPRNFRVLEHARCANGYNPLCGDRVSIFLDIERGVIREVSFQGNGCAISTASASLMTEAVKGKDRAAVQSLYDKVHELLTQQDAPTDASLGKLAALSGVREFPARVKCASLCWHTLNAALAHGAATVSTE